MATETPLSTREPFICRMDDRAKLICVLAFVLCAVLAPTGEWHRFLGLGGVLLVTFLLGRLPLGAALRRLVLLVPILVLVVVSILLAPVDDGAEHLLIPGTERVVSAEAARRFGSVLCGATLSILAMAALAQSCDFERIAAALGRLRLPRIMVMLLLMSYRYMRVLAEEARRMIRARDSRGRPERALARARVAGTMVGALFVRSLDRGEHVADAMAARGFDGAFRLLSQSYLRLADVLAAAAFCGTAVLVVWV